MFNSQGLWSNIRPLPTWVVSGWQTAWCTECWNVAAVGLLSTQCRSEPAESRRRSPDFPTWTFAAPRIWTYCSARSVPACLAEGASSSLQWLLKAGHDVERLSMWWTAQQYMDQLEGTHESAYLCQVIFKYFGVKWPWPCPFSENI